MLIGVDDSSYDVITLGMCFSMFVYIRARFRFTLTGGSLTARSTGATGELEVEFKFQRRSCKFSFLFPPAARPPERHGELARWLVELGFRISIVKGIPDSWC